MFDEYTGELLEDYKVYLKAGACLVVMPISRVDVEWFPRTYPSGITFYPKSYVNLESLQIKPNDPNSKSLAEATSAASGIDQEILDRHPLIVFPINTDWDNFRQSGHSNHLDLIRTLSDHVDRSCLNFIRYLQCPLEPIDSLPGQAGTINSNPMMAGALLYNHFLREARIIGGAAFTHTITRGLGLPLESVDQELFPKEGEVGYITNHALALYTTLLEANSSTFRFVQAMSLLEFLAYPDEYKKEFKFKKVAKVIAKYVAKNQVEYMALLDRFFELTGKKDNFNSKVIGYRTRIVHMGENIESIIPSNEERKDLFLELQGYIKTVIDHMINHSSKSWQEYLVIRERLKPFEL